VGRKRCSLKATRTACAWGIAPRRRFAFGSRDCKQVLLESRNRRVSWAPSTGICSRLCPGQPMN
jgi:hypothetical protein